LLFGDFHQLGPVGARALHHHKEKTKYDQSPDAILGRKLYTQFQTAVRLTQQFRCVDPVWNDVLLGVRGDIPFTKAHVDVLRSLILPQTPDLIAAFQEEAKKSEVDWRNAVLISPRRLDRDEWNKNGVEAFAVRTKQPIYVCPAIDLVKGNQELSARQKAEVKSLVVAKQPVSTSCAFNRRLR
jgi:hypothetical protein